MHTIKRYGAILILIWAVTPSGHSQSPSYILKRQTYKIPLTSINISPDGSVLLAGFDDGTFRLLDPDTYAIQLEVNQAHTKSVNAMDMSPASDYIFTAGAHMIKQWDRNGNHLFDWSEHATTIWNMEISPDGRWAVSSAINKTFLLWDVSRHTIHAHMRGHTDVCMSVCFSPDSQLIASGSNDHTIRVWDLESIQVITELHGPTSDIYDVEFSPDSRLLVAASKDRSARLYDIKAKKLLHILKGHSDMVMEAEFSPDGNYLITGSADRSLILWDVESGERIYRFLDNEEAVMDLVFHPDGLSFYSISYAGDLTRWELHPEIFVLKYFEEQYRDELESDPVFEPRRAGESRKDYQVREAAAGAKKSEIISRYYQQYLSARER